MWRETIRVVVAKDKGGGVLTNGGVIVVEVRASRRGMREAAKHGVLTDSKMIRYTMFNAEGEVEVLGRRKPVGIVGDEVRV